MKIIVPPLKSQGIKTKLVPLIRSIALDYNGRWIEPFLGTGVVAFNEAPNVAVLNDLNPHIIQFYSEVQEGKITPQIVRSYLEEQDGLLKKASEDGYAHYRKIKDRFNLKHDSLDFLFLSRAGFNGMMRFNKKGQWNIPFCKKPNRFRRSHITKIANQVQMVSEIINRKWKFTKENFPKIIEEATKGDMIYCDPPYLGRYADYYSSWGDEDEEKLFKVLAKTRARFILSTWHHNEFRSNHLIELYWRKFNIITRDHFYHSGAKIKNRRPMVEALVFNFEPAT